MAGPVDEGGEEEEEEEEESQEEGDHEAETLHRLCPTYASDINSPLRHVRSFRGLRNIKVGTCGRGSWLRACS